MDSNTRVILIGLENPDGSLNGALSVIETLDGFKFDTSGDEKERNLLRSTHSDAGSVIGAKMSDITLPVELKGGGLSVGVIQQPEMHPAFLASGMVVEAAKMLTVTVTAGTFDPAEPLTNTTAANALGTIAHAFDNGDGTWSIWVRDLQNAPADADAIVGDTSAATATIDASGIEDALCYRMVTSRSQYPTCQIHAHKDGIRYIGKRALASFSFDWQAGEYATVQFAIKSVYETPTDQALPSATYNDFIPPIGESAGLTIEGYGDGTIEKFSFSQSNDVVPVPDINSADGRHSFRIRGRKPSGSIDPEVLTLAEFNPFSLWENGTKAPIHATLGSVPGEQISVVVTAAQFTRITDKERAGNDAYDLNYRATGKNDDEFYLFFH